MKTVSASDDRSSTWTFLTHHARVLLEIARDPQARMRDIAAGIGITERAVQGIVTDLHQAGYLSRDRVGRRNHYSLNLDEHLPRTRCGRLEFDQLQDIGGFADRGNLQFVHGCPSRCVGTSSV